jgi:hypothetical protein
MNKSHQLYMFTNCGAGLDTLSEDQLYELLWCKETADRPYCAPGFFIKDDFDRYTKEEIENAIKLYHKN